MFPPGVVGHPVLAFDVSPDQQQNQQNPYAAPYGAGYYFPQPYPDMQPYHGIQESLQHPKPTFVYPHSENTGSIAINLPAVEIPAPGMTAATATRAPVSKPDPISVVDNRQRHLVPSSPKSRERANRAITLIKSIAEDNHIKNFHKQAWFKCLIAFLIWLFSGVIFYTQWQEWSFSTSLYYTIQAGMSIGFGFPSEDFICEKEDFRPGNAAKYYADDQYDGPTNNGRGGCLAADISKLVTTILILSGSSIVAAAIGVLAQAILGSSSSWYKTFLRDVEHEELKLAAASTDTWTDDVTVWAKILMRTDVFKAVFQFLLWCAVGVIYGMLSEQRMSFLTALYFSVSSISTAGLESLKPLGKDSERGAEIEWQELDDGHFLFVSFFCLIGVPLYAWALTTIAAGFVQHLNQIQMRSSVYDKLSEDEFQLTLCLGDGKLDDEVDMHRWVELHLLRLNKVSVSDLFFIKKAFIELDVDASGKISREELINTGAHGDDTAGPRIQKALANLREMHEKMRADDPA